MTFEVIHPAGTGVPVLFDSPHSGRDYPADFGSSARMRDLRRGEDAYVDELITGASIAGITSLIARVPRCYLDLNRSVDDIDQAMIDSPWPGPLNPTDKSARGLGLIRRLVVPGVPIYDRLLSVAEVQHRIDQVHAPYHSELDRLRAGLLTRHGRLWHINWHSMKSVGNAMTPDGTGARRPDFVVGDAHGTSADPAVTDLVVTLLKRSGYSVAVNTPYPGGLITRRLGKPALGVHSVQVEINRALYLDEAAVTRHDGFPRLQATLAAVADEVAHAAVGSNPVGLPA